MIHHSEVGIDICQPFDPRVPMILARAERSNDVKSPFQINGIDFWNVTWFNVLEPSGTI